MAIPFWEIKWLIRDKLVADFDPSKLNPIQISRHAAHRLCREYLRQYAGDELDAITTDCLISELMREFFTHQPLIHATVLPST
jgi:hypothetical protein